MCARIAVPRLQPKLQRIEPAPLQSRVIALELRPPAGVGNSDFCFTPQLGNRLWLYSVDVWAYCTSPAPGIGGFFYLQYGQGIPQSTGDISVRWTPIIPLHCGVKPGFGWFDCVSFHRRFEMAKLFTTEELRFGVVVENFGTQAWVATVAFEISEG